MKCSLLCKTRSTFHLDSPPLCQRVHICDEHSSDNTTPTTQENNNQTRSGVILDLGSLSVGWGVALLQHNIVRGMHWYADEKLEQYSNNF